jgi:colicin import membrane protein
MSTATLTRDAFAPQRPPGMRKGLLLALAAHALLILALAWSVNWKASEPEGIVAELWSALPQAAAPRAAPPPTPMPPVVEPTPPVVEPTPPPVQAKPPPPKPEPQAAPRPDPQIAIEREAKRKAELQKREDAKQAEAERQREREKERQKELQRQRVAEEAEKKKVAEKAKQDEARLAAIREANLRRMMKEAGTSDDPAATGTAARTSGPSASYAGRIKARIKPNIVLTGNVSGNPTASVEVRCAPDGTIVGRRILKSSGSPVWDETVLRAIDKTEVLPKDTDGRVPASMTIDFRPLE